MSRPEEAHPCPFVPWRRLTYSSVYQQLIPGALKTIGSTILLFFFTSIEPATTITSCSLAAISRRDGERVNTNLALINRGRQANAMTSPSGSARSLARSPASYPFLTPDKLVKQKEPRATNSIFLTSGERAMTLKDVQIFGPDEPVLMSRRASIEQPVSGSGTLYLTDRRLILIHRSGHIRKTETPLLDLTIEEISYARIEGTFWKALVVGARTQGGRLVTYKIHAQNPQVWKAQIYSLKGGGRGIRFIPPRTPPSALSEALHAPLPRPTTTKFCTDCGQGLPPEAAFCSSCGRLQKASESASDNPPG